MKLPKFKMPKMPKMPNVGKMANDAKGKVTGAVSGATDKVKGAVSGTSKKVTGAIKNLNPFKKQIDFGATKRYNKY